MYMRELRTDPPGHECANVRNGAARVRIRVVGNYEMADFRRTHYELKFDSTELYKLQARFGFRREIPWNSRGKGIFLQIRRDFRDGNLTVPL